MKKRWVLLYIMAMAVSQPCRGADAPSPKDEPVKVFVNGAEKRFDPPAIIRDGRTYVPLRAGAEAIDGTVKWDEKTCTATITLGCKRTRIAASQGINVDGRLLLPLRAMGEALDCTVKWDSGARAVHIGYVKTEPAVGGG